MSVSASLPAKAVFWATPRGGADCIVVRVDRAALRIAHVRDAAEAMQLKEEWADCDFSHNAGRIDVFNRFKKKEQVPCEN